MVLISIFPFLTFFTKEFHFVFVNPSFLAFFFASLLTFLAWSSYRLAPLVCTVISLLTFSSSLVRLVFLSDHERYMLLAFVSNLSIARSIRLIFTSIQSKVSLAFFLSFSDFLDDFLDDFFFELDFEDLLVVFFFLVDEELPNSLRPPFPDA